VSTKVQRSVTYPNAESSRWPNLPLGLIRVAKLSSRLSSNGNNCRSPPPDPGVLHPVMVAGS